MTDYSITISNNLIVVGYNPTSAWGTLVWGTDSWRFNGETLQDVDKAINFGPVTLSDAPIKDVEHLTDLGSTLLSDSISKDTTRGINNTVATAFEISSAFITDANGYYRVFIGDVIDAENRVGAAWSGVSGTTTTWALLPDPSAVWS